MLVNNDAPAGIIAVEDKIKPEARPLLLICYALGLKFYVYRR